MSKENAIIVKDLSKKFLKRTHANNFRDYILKQPWRKRKHYFWALRDVNFKVEKGEIFGIIGSNGSGKSTLLKIISGLIWPTEGEINIFGKVSSLLEVGAGFHYDLTGRENVYLNGALLGMKKSEITESFDDIVDFSGVGEYIDMPVKFYSSGMYVRLAFSVASFLRQDIILVDEVLAVGDHAFKEKCVKLMNSKSKEEGKTILYVSHNLSLVKKICRNGILMEKGKLKKHGLIKDIVSTYLHYDFNKKPAFENKNIIVSSFHINDIPYFDQPKISAGDPFVLNLKINTKIKISNLIIRVQVRDESGKPMFVLNNILTENRIYHHQDELTATCKVDSLPLNIGKYILDIEILDGKHSLIQINTSTSIIVLKGNFYNSSFMPALRRGKFLVKHEWEIK